MTLGKQAGRALVGCVLLIALVSAAAVASSPVYFKMGSFNNGAPYRTYIKPGTFVVPSEDSSVRFFRLHWTHWGAGVATAHGLVKTRDYDSGTTATAAVTLTAERRVGRHYTVVIASRIPMYGSHSLRLPTGH